MNLSASEDSWSNRVARFSAALVDAELSAPSGIGKQGAEAPKRFSVYRNNVIVSLMETLEGAFPSTLALLGQENFDRIARAYVGLHMPTSPLMQVYGDKFPDFVKTLPALDQLPFLHDLARLERAVMDAFHARDCEPLDASLLAELSPEETMQLRFTAAPSTRLIASSYCVVDLFELRNDAEAVPDDMEQPQSVLVTRIDFEIERTQLSSSEAAFFEALIDGKTLAEAIGLAMEDGTAFDPTLALTKAFQSQAFSAATTEGSDTEGDQQS